MKRLYKGNESFLLYILRYGIQVEEQAFEGRHEDGGFQHTLFQAFQVCVIHPEGVRCKGPKLRKERL